MSTQTIGRLFVAAQVALLITIVALPSADHWPTPTWLERVGVAVVLGGVALVLVASTRLGAALTPTPVPKANAPLATSGLYQHVRHPIYTGVMVAVVAVAARSGNTVTATVALALIVFFNIKARWEENQLQLKHPDYTVYAQSTPRFLPPLGPRQAR